MDSFTKEQDESAADDRSFQSTDEYRKIFEKQRKQLAEAVRLSMAKRSLEQFPVWDSEEKRQVLRDIYAQLGEVKNAPETEEVLARRARIELAFKRMADDTATDEDEQLYLQYR
jgi:uncharacterized membrane protein YccC